MCFKAKFGKRDERGVQGLLRSLQLSGGQVQRLFRQGQGDSLREEKGYPQGGHERDETHEGIETR